MLAVSWYRKAADQGNAYAQYTLGGMYDRGEGVEKDAVQAVSWYRKAADQGNAYAQYNLGRMYDSGEGVTPNAIAAYMWTSLALAVTKSHQMQARVSAALDRVASRMTPAQIAEAQKAASEWQKAFNRRGS